jgi:translation elongation factor EF-Tu-like GTPase
MGALLRGVKREQMKRGQVIIAPGSMKPITKFQAQIYVRTDIVNPICKPEPIFLTGPNKR